MSEYWADARHHRAQQAKKNWAAFDPTGWTKHCATHYSRDLLGDRLDYWPTRQRFRWRGRTYTGGVVGFIARKEGVGK